LHQFGRADPLLQAQITVQQHIAIKVHQCREIDPLLQEIIAPRPVGT